MGKIYTVDNSQLGSITIDSGKIITFTEGLIGFEDLSNFAIVDFEEFQPFQWLLSVEEPEIAFPIISPILVVEEYNPVITRADAYNLGEFTDESLLLYAIVTIRPEFKKVTANLKGPVIINQQLRLGQQIVLADERFSTSHEFMND